LHVHDDDRHFSHDRQADVFAIQRDTRPAGGGEGARAGHGRAQAEAQRGDLVFGLDGDAAHLGQFADHMQQDGRGGGDGVSGEEGAACVERPARDGLCTVYELSHHRSQSLFGWVCCPEHSGSVEGAASGDGH